MNTHNNSLVHVGNNIVGDVREQTLDGYLCTLSLVPQASRGELGRLVYDTCPAYFCGRDKEIEDLEKFLDAEPKLLWWAITGEAGAGKTKLAFEFLKKVNQKKDWVGRFIKWEILKRYVEKNNSASLDKNVVIVIDYIFSCESEIASLINELSAMELRMKIRFLLIERDDVKYNKYGEKRIAPWEELFTRNEYSYLSRTKYASGNLNLSRLELDTEDAITIIQSYCSKNNHNYSREQCRQILTQAMIGNNKHINPLQVLLFAEHAMLVHMKCIEGNALRNILLIIIEREIKQLYSVYSSEKHEILIKLFLICSIVGIITSEDSYCKETKISNNSISDILTRNVQRDTMFSATRSLSGFQPDLVGEFFVFYSLQCMNMSDNEIKTFLDGIHMYYPNALQRFSSRLFDDYHKFTDESRIINIFANYLPNEAMTFKVMNDQGEEVTCEALFTFESDDTGKNYIVYTDNSIDEDGNTKVYASIYDPEKDETKLLPIETDSEWKIIEKILHELQNGKEVSVF